jgi:hypothetical protein
VETQVEAEVKAAEVAAGAKAGGRPRAKPPKPPKACGCPYLPAAPRPRHGGSVQYGALERLQDRLLQSPHDIEQLRALGKEEGACPYYAGRGAVGEAELVLLPCAACNITTPCSLLQPLADPCHPLPFLVSPNIHIHMRTRGVAGMRRCCTRRRARRWA